MSFIIKGQEDAYQSLLTALGQRDLYTKGHCERVHKLALHMGIALGLPAADLETLHIASILHDIGKVGIPDAILLKPGRLSGVEWEKMQAHSIYGEQIISNTLF